MKTNKTENTKTNQCNHKESSGLSLFCCDWWATARAVSGKKREREQERELNDSERREW